MTTTLFFLLGIAIGLRVRDALEELFNFETAYDAPLYPADNGPKAEQ